MKALVILFVAIGIVVVIISILGCIAALVESKRTLIVYYGFVLALFLFLVICVVIGFTYRSKLTENLRADLVASVGLYDPLEPDKVETKAWDTMQHDLQCCGVSTTVTVNGTTKATALPHQIWTTNKKLNSGTADSR